MPAMSWRETLRAWPIVCATAAAVTVAVTVAQWIALGHGGFSHDDWEWLGRSQDLLSFLSPFDERGDFKDVYRPLHWVLYPLHVALFGDDAVRMARSLFLLRAAASVALYAVFVRLGFPRLTAAIAVICAWASPALQESSSLISLNETTLARALAAGLWLEFLRRERPPRAWVWFPLSVAGWLSHEQFVAAVPILLLMRAWRDGPGRAWRDVLDGDLRAVTCIAVSLTSLRVAGYLLAAGTSHTLGFDAVLRNADHLLQHVIRAPMAWGGVMSPDLMLGCAVAAAIVGGRALMAARGGGAEGPTVLRSAGLCAGLVALAYAPFLGQRDYVSAYFVNTAVHGVTLLGAVVFTRWILPQPGRRLAVVADLLAAAVLFLWMPKNVILPAVRHAEAAATLDVIAAAAEGDAPPGQPLRRLVFVEPGDGPDERFGGPALPFGEGPGGYLIALGSDFKRDHRQRVEPHLNPVWAVHVRFPGWRWIASVAWEGQLPWLCVRSDDVLVRLEPVPPAAAASPGGTGVGHLLELFDPAGRERLLQRFTTQTRIEFRAHPWTAADPPVGAALAGVVGEGESLGAARRALCEAWRQGDPRDRLEAATALWHVVKDGVDPADPAATAWHAAQDLMNAVLTHPLPAQP